MALPCIYDVLRSAKSLRFLFSLLPQMIITRVSGQLSRPWPTSPQSVTLQHCTARRSKQRGQSHSVQKYRSAFVSVEAAGLKLVARKPKCKQKRTFERLLFCQCLCFLKEKIKHENRTKNEKIPFFETMRFFSRSWWGSMLRNFLPGWRKFYFKDDFILILWW